MARKVLSIQSHVVHGYVGNKAATFPLQYRGWDVDALNTVQFSNHPGYGHFKGFRSEASDLQGIIEKGLLGGLDIQYDAVLTGYLPDIEGLRAIGKTLIKLCEEDHRVKWVLDPVLGDNGKLYVPEEAIPAYRDILTHGAVYLATPNQFEMEVLTGVQICDLASLKQSIQQFHELYRRVQNVVVTSVSFHSAGDSISELICACSEQESRRAHYFKVSKIDAQFSGSGDLCSALLLDSFLTQNPAARDLCAALNQVLSLVDSILLNTFELYKASTAAPPLKINDLRLIESRELLKQTTAPKYVPIKL